MTLPVLFMGSPDFAVPCLDALLSRADLVRVVGRDCRGETAVSHASMIAVVSTVVGMDLTDWFGTEWDLRDPAP